MKKNKLIATALVSIFFLTLSFSSAFALDLLPDLSSAGQNGAGYSTAGENTIPQMVGNVVGAILSFVAAIFFILIIYSGIQWMTAGGNEEKVTKARTRLINAAVGLGITLAAYFITWFISQIFLANA